ncbi:aldehyde dehydrogenase [Beggiatoa leptomitoformis]|uniref:Aldehyde dehydrogenase family protein n=1 Tax=Beggiatoa leptomitoformis TaxID=288004 RepID=A0A2N9YIN3_9GAMM|nr:aldehyde dehydrogenase [Beggiatoa leptomitoformis]ALG67389.1 aldehyde dehydrogenase family protein [Beggiatoa leptomitoformis]AUI70401.1 aldehyde dehydrogenase family protein [Beggiatoa leptomitoformis]
MQKTLADWQQLASQVQLPTQSFINGNYVNALSGKTFATVNPATGQVLAQIAACDSEDADLAVASARQVFNKGTWSKAAPIQRKKALIKFAALIEAHLDELALLETLDVGKPISDSCAVDIRGAARCIAWYGEAIDKRHDELLPTERGSLAMVTREPVGVVAAIVPWNFPLLMTAWKIAPALAAGNSVILKPSEKSPLTALRIAELAVQAGIPEGVLNVLSGYGHTVGKALALHMDVDCAAFTGSTRTGRQILQYSGQSNLKRVWLECGGKSPNIVFADCPDLDKAAAASAFAIFYNQGEMCSAGSRLLVEASIKEELLAKIQQIGESMFPRNPLDPETKMGAIVDDIQLKSVLGYIEAGKEAGANVFMGGKQVLTETGGYFVEPTIFDSVKQSMKIAQEEIFGPVLSVLTFENAEEAINIANDTIYGLAAGLWTRDINKAHNTAKAIRAGTVWVNCYDEGDLTSPFGGYKQSGNGRDKSIHALEKYEELKTTWIKLGNS